MGAAAFTAAAVANACYGVHVLDTDPEMALGDFAGSVLMLLIAGGLAKAGRGTTRRAAKQRSIDGPVTGGRAAAQGDD